MRQLDDVTGNMEARLISIMRYINGMSTGHLVETPYRFSNLSTSSNISVSITLMDRSIFFKYYISNLSVPLQLLVALWIDV